MGMRQHPMTLNTINCGELTMSNIIYKECKCKHHVGGRVIPIENFRKDKSKKDGLSP